MTCQTNNCTVFGCAMCPVSVWCVCGRNAAAPVPLTSRSLVLLELLNAALAAGCISPLMTWSRGGGTWNCHWNASSSSSSQPLGIPDAFLLGGAFSLGRAFSLGVGLHVACLGFCSLALEVEVGLVRVRERVRVRVRVAVRVGWRRRTHSRRRTRTRSRSRTRTRSREAPRRRSPPSSRPAMCNPGL